MDSTDLVCVSSCVFWWCSLWVYCWIFQRHSCYSSCFFVFRFIFVILLLLLFSMSVILFLFFFCFQVFLLFIGFLLFLVSPSFLFLSFSSSISSDYGSLYYSPLLVSISWFHMTFSLMKVWNLLVFISLYLLYSMKIKLFSNDISAYCCYIFIRMVYVVSNHLCITIVDDNLSIMNYLYFTILNFLIFVSSVVGIFCM